MGARLLNTIRRGTDQVPYFGAAAMPRARARALTWGRAHRRLRLPGLVLYSFAGAGIVAALLGSGQYNLGRKYPGPADAPRRTSSSTARNGSQHVTIYLGNGQMSRRLTSPEGGLRLCTAGMTPYVVRYIEH